MFSGNNINQIEFYLIEKCLYLIYYLAYCLIKKIIIFMIKSYKINFSNKGKMSSNVGREWRFVYRYEVQLSYNISNSFLFNVLY